MRYDRAAGCALMESIREDYKNIGMTINQFISGSKDDLKIFEDSVGELIAAYQDDKNRVGWDRPLSFILLNVRDGDFNKALQITNDKIAEINKIISEKNLCVKDVPGGKRKSNRRKSKRRKSKRSRKSRRRQN